MHTLFSQGTALIFHPEWCSTFPSLFILFLHQFHLPNVSTAFCLVCCMYLHPALDLYFLFCSCRKFGINLYYLDFPPHVIVFALWLSPAFIPLQLSSLQSKFNVDRLILSLPDFIPGSIVFSEETFRFHHDNGCMHSRHHKWFPVFVACWMEIGKKNLCIMCDFHLREREKK